MTAQPGAGGKISTADPLLSGIKPESRDAGTRLLLIALATATLFHGALLPFTHGNTYDAFIHMFFGDHYYRNWFDPWEPRWYTGFSTTSYPPGTHMAIGALRHIMPLRAAFVVVQMVGILLLTVGVYRYSLLWVTPRAAGFAAITLTLSSSISETLHLFGQLPTIFSLGVFLNGMPFVYRWIVLGKWRNLAGALVFGSATTAAHHVTTLFGAVLFIVPLAFQALRTVAELNPLPAKSLHGSQLRSQFWFLWRPATQWRRKLAVIARFGWPLARGILLAVGIVGAMVITIFPYWYWSITDPITQVPIPHGSRESFIKRTDLGFVFFLLPWGTSLLLLPYAVYKGLTTRLWPLAATLVLCFVLGTGGTTPIPRIILRGAFDILTLDRFTFWASILILPFIGVLFDGLFYGRSGKVLCLALGRGANRIVGGGLLASYMAVAILCAVLPVIRPMQPTFIDPTPMVSFLEQDQHNRWRYLTLGFGDQFAYVSALTTAQSVDGNYHSARRLPDMMRFSVERLENSKYLGVPGLGSLQQFLVNTDRYHLKYVFSNDEFYDPLLIFTGWNRLNRLGNGVVIWEKPDVAPLPLLQPRRELSNGQNLLWGLLPPSALILAGIIFVTSFLRHGFSQAQAEYRPLVVAQDRFMRPTLVRRIVFAMGVIAVLSAIGGGTWAWIRAQRPAPPDQVIEAYFNDLDFRRYADAYARLDPKTREDFETVNFQWHWRGGLIASYGKLIGFRSEVLAQTEDLVDWRIHLDWLTAMDVQHQVLEMRGVKRGAHWFVVPTELRPQQTPVRMQREAGVLWNVTGRRQPLADTDLHRDRLDRPEISISGARLVRHNGLYSVVGQVFNAGSEPAYLTLQSDLRGDADQVLAKQAAAMVNGQRLLPAESSGFRIVFEGVLSLRDAAAAAGYDPKLFVPPILEATPVTATIDARALVATANLYRGIALNGLSFTEDSDGLKINGIAANVGTLTASVIRIIAMAYDETGAPIWVDLGYVDSNILPGQTAPFEVRLPKRSSIEVISEITPNETMINGSGAREDPNAPQSGEGTVRLNNVAGYGALRFQVSSMTYEPEF
jgi:hypothetical protein